MFEKARLELTGWYLVIIMTISILFSGSIYRLVGLEFERRLNMIEHRMMMDSPGRGPRMEEGIFKEDLKAAKKGVVLALIWANGVILILAGGAGYLLAGKTLKPMEEALEEQKRFVADASHELKTPLTVLKTSIEVALRKKKMEAKEARAVIKDNLEEVERLQKLSESLLSLARHQDGQNGFHFKKSNVDKIIKKAVKKIEPLAQRKGVRLEVKSSKVLIRTDQERIEELLTILIDNGIKYSRKGGVVKIYLEKDKRGVKIRVKDEGIGISRKDLPHVFDRFYRADQARSKQNRTGFGLGLAVAKKIVEQHRGTIKVMSSEGKGSEFVVKLVG
jgi:two-component system, OmpR family, sensor histidine kinase CiaH